MKQYLTSPLCFSSTLGYIQSSFSQRCVLSSFQRCVCCLLKYPSPPSFPPFPPFFYVFESIGKAFAACRDAVASKKRRGRDSAFYIYVEIISRQFRLFAIYYYFIILLLLLFFHVVFPRDETDFPFFPLHYESSTN